MTALRSKYSPALMWIIVVLSATANVLEGKDGSRLGLPIVVAILGFGLFAIVHSFARYGVKNTIVFAVIAIVVSTFYENLSVLTGIPFGNYHYTEAMGPRLLHVPLLAIVGYFFLAYMGWTLTSVLLNRYDNKLSGRDILIFPLIASFVTVMWDFGVDPIFATIGKAYIWADGGPYFGVPFSNFMGWYLCMFTIFFLSALYVSIQKDIPSPAILRKRVFWLQSTITYFAPALQLPMLVFFAGNESVTTANGQVWTTGDIYQSMTLVAITTILFVTVLGMVGIATSKELE